VHNKLRNRLADDSVQLQMYFAFNTRALDLPRRNRLRKVDEPTGVEEIDDDEPIVQRGIRGTLMLSRYHDEELAAVEDVKEEERKEEEAEKEQDVEEEMEDEEEEEEEEEEEGTGKENKEEEGKQERQSEDERVQALVEKFVADHRITQITRWKAAQEQMLQGAIVEAGLLILVSDMKARIKAHLAAPPAAALPSFEPL
jgi:type IV secretory pathway VirB10-like protein